MRRFDLFSKRQKDAANAGQADVYRYDVVPSSFRVQLLNIANTAFGQDRSYSASSRKHKSNSNWAWIDETFSHEKGVPPLGGEEHFPEYIRKYYSTAGVEDALDLTEIIAFCLDVVDELDRKRFADQGRSETPEARIDEVNYRLREAGMGYQVENGRLVRVDSQFVHGEIVKPALTILSAPGFEGAQEEFLKAHEHYRAGDNKEAVAMAANALESTFKAVFDKKGWTYSKRARISDLIKVARANVLWPDYLDNSFDQLTATLQSGLPKIRDNDASHGQGSAPRDVPSYIAGYALHLAASKIVFIASAADAKP